MSISLRISFLVSAALHVAAVAAFSPPVQHEIPAVDDPRPINLRLSVFRPTQAAPVMPSTAEPLLPAPVVETPPSEPVIAQATPNPPIKLEPLAPAKPFVAKPDRRKPPVLSSPVAAPKPVPEQMSQPQPPVSAPPPPMIVAKADASQPAVPMIDMQASQHYLAALAAQINRSKFYPRASRRRGEEGMAVVGFVIQRNGELTDLTIVESSGHRRLDDAALKTLQRVTPFEKIPDAINRERWPITVPIAFSLRG